MIVDAHAHIFSEVAGRCGAGENIGLSHGRIRCGADELQLMPPLNEQVIHTPEMLIAAMDWAGIDKAVLLQGPFYGECDAYVLEAVKQFPDRLTGLKYVDPWDGSSLENLDLDGFVGVKLECSVAAGYSGFRDNVRLDDSRLDSLWSQLEAQHLTLTLDLGTAGDSSYQTAAVGGIATKYPDLRIVIAHLAQPRHDHGESPELHNTWCEQLDLAKLPNVWFDVAALPYYATPEPYPYPAAQAWVREAVDRIGADSVLYGTDTPGLLSIANYPQLLGWFEAAIADLPETENQAMLGGNAASAYNLGSS